jgi:peptide deformylase
MSKTAIITLPNPLLRQKSRRIGHIDQSVQKLAETMIESTLAWEDSREHEFGAALAAVQIGQLYRVIVVRHDFDDKENRQFDVYINPEIVKAEGSPTEELEGCLSVAGIYGAVARYPKVKVRALDQTGKPIRVTAKGFLARVFQHEIDHMNGMVFVDRVSDSSKLYRLEPSGQFSPLSVDLKPQADGHPEDR